ncbi:HAD family hydrolase [Paenibacillus shenyangensis]|uniref:HAD family hydrolase n=1 Tax=Paenibacillus sp. A9 TaxID=1284352 RepID=UPI000360E93E|nr:HAD family hydrolase [Paenibacillus sp. A9]
MTINPNQAAVNVVSSAAGIEPTDWQREPVEGFIFDMDGVLIDSEPIYFEIEKSTFIHFGANVEEEEHHTYVGVTLASMFEQVQQKHLLDCTVEQMLEFHVKHVMDVIREHPELQPFNGLTDWLDWLKQSGIPMVVASSSPRALIELILERLDIRRFFEGMISGEEVAHGKPAPDIFLRAAEILGVAPERCMVIEDSRNGVRAAKSAGMRCIGHQNPGSGNQNLGEADVVIHSYAELWELRDQLPVAATK